MKDEFIKKILFYHPDGIIINKCGYNLKYEVDLFNNHIEFYTQNNEGYEEGHSFNIFEAAEYFYNKVNEVS